MLVSTSGMNHRDPPLKLDDSDNTTAASDDRGRCWKKAALSAAIDVDGDGIPLPHLSRHPSTRAPISPWHPRDLYARDSLGRPRSLPTTCRWCANSRPPVHGASALPANAASLPSTVVNLFRPTRGPPPDWTRRSGCLEARGISLDAPGPRFPRSIPAAQAFLAITTSSMCRASPHASFSR